MCVHKLDSFEVKGRLSIISIIIVIIIIITINIAVIIYLQLLLILSLNIITVTTVNHIFFIKEMKGRRSIIKGTISSGNLSGHP